MKKLFNITFTVLAIISLSIACSKETAEDIVPDVPQEENPQKPEQPKQITISATLSDDILSLVPSSTKVSFDPSVDENGKITSMTLKWELTDKLRITDASNAEKYSIFSNPSISEDGKTAYFTGDLPTGAEAYNVSVLDGKANPEPDTESGITTLTQPSDGVSNVKYWAEATNVSEDDLHDNFTLNHLSGILALTIKMPSTVEAANVMSLNITASEDIFYGGNTLTLKFDEGGDANNDGLLYFFATLPAYSCTDIPACSLIVHINAPKTAHTVYTRYIEMGATTFTAGKVNRININATNSATYANAIPKPEDINSLGTAANPYLIGDKYQMDALHDLLLANQTTYVKLIDDIDMNGVKWTTMLNNPSPYNRLIDLDGNNKTISNLSGSLFYVFKGSVKNLVLDSCTPAAGTHRGVFAQYIQATGHTVTNVDITNSSVPDGTNVGALIGRINSGTDGTTAVTFTDCDITNTTVGGGSGSGGLIGSVEAEIIISNCTVSNGSVTGSGDNDGGLIGNMTKATSITNCSVTGTDVTGGSVVGGLVGFANGLITMSGCTYSGGTVSTAGRFLGGAIGSTANVASVISNCHVENATITSTTTDDARCGGFIGQSQTSVQIKGCTVGSDSKKVIINTATPAEGKVLNAGGFVGVNYGTITKNESIRSKAYVQVKSSNNIGQPINVGGFAGFHRGTIEYSDAIVEMSDLQGQYIGGFSGYMMHADSKADNCTLLGSVRGNNYTGGFVGVADIAAITNCQVLEGTVVVGQSTAGGFAAQIKAGTVEDCSANTTMQSRGGNCGGFVGALTGGTVQRCSSAGTLSQIESTNSVFGGFAGYVNGADLTKCSSTVNITVARSYVGGLVGDFQTANTVSECFYNGTISGPTNTKGGLIGRTSAAAVVITNCYTAGELIASSGTQIYGGIVGELLAGGSVTNCYSTMDMTHGGRATGGIVGRACSGGWPVSNASNNTISKCIAWNPNITFDGNASSSASSGAIVGYTSFKNILNNCYRRYDMVYKNSNTAVGTSCQTSMVDQVDCDGTNWAINGNRPAGGTPAGTSASAQYQAPYYGVAAASNATVSSIAQTLGWSSDVWDFSGALPTLK